MTFHKITEIAGHSSGIYCLQKHGEFLYSGSADRFVTRWDLENGEQDKFAIQFPQPVYSLAVLLDGNALAVGLADGSLYFFDLIERKEKRHFVQHKSAVFGILENKITGHCYSTDADGNLAVWDLNTFNLLLFLPFNCGKIRRITCSPDGKLIALACQDEIIRILETTHYNEIQSFRAHNDGCTSVLFHPEQTELLFSGGKDAILRKWNWQTGEMLEEIPAHNYAIYDLISLNNGKLLASASRDKSIKIWDTQNLGFLQKLDIKSGGHRHSVNVLAKLTENAFVSASDDRRIIRWSE